MDFFPLIFVGFFSQAGGVGGCIAVVNAKFDGFYSNFSNCSATSTGGAVSLRNKVSHPPFSPYFPVHTTISHGLGQKQFRGLYVHALPC